jgi:hypothetical protein
MLPDPITSTFIYCCVVFNYVLTSSRFGDALNKKYAIVIILYSAKICFPVFAHGLDWQSDEVSFDISNPRGEFSQFGAISFFCFSFSLDV